MLDVLSEIDSKTDNPFLDTCTVIGGDGTVMLHLKKGRGEIPDAHAQYFAGHQHLKVIGYDGPPFVGTPAEEEKKSNQAVLDALANALQGHGGETLEAQHLREDQEALGESTAPVEKTESPEDFEALTADGEERCQARKGDGSQCSNAAHDGPACGIATHRERFTP